MALQITDANFEELVNSGKPMVLDFWAEWCGPCRMVSPIIDELATEYEGRVTIGKMNVDENDDVVGQFGIRNIPTVLFFKDGKMAHLKTSRLHTSAYLSFCAIGYDHSARCGMSIQTIIDFLIPHLRLFLGRKCVEIDQIDIIR